MWFKTLAESVVGIKIDHGVTLEGPVLRASPGSVEGGVLILLSAVGKVVRIEEELRILLPRQKLGKHNNHFKDLMKDSLESFYIFCTCCFTLFLTSFYLHYSTRVDQQAKKSLLSHLAWIKNLLCYMIHYGTYRGAVVGLRGAVVGLRGTAVGVRGAAVGNIGIPTYVISSYLGAQLSAISAYLHTSYLGVPAIISVEDLAW